MEKIDFSTRVGLVTVSMGKHRATVSQRDEILKKTQRIELSSALEVKTLIDALREVEFELNKPTA